MGHKPQASVSFRASLIYTGNLLQIEIGSLNCKMTGPKLVSARVSFEEAQKRSLKCSNSCPVGVGQTAVK